MRCEIQTATIERPPFSIPQKKDRVECPWRPQKQPDFYGTGFALLQWTPIGMMPSSVVDDSAG